MCLRVGGGMEEGEWVAGVREALRGSFESVRECHGLGDVPLNASSGVMGILFR